MTGQGGTASPGQQPEPLIEPGADLRHRQRSQPGRGELQGQRDPVQAHADRRHRRGVGVIEGEALPVHGGALGEQLHRLERGQPAGGGEIGGRDGQRRNPEDVLSADAQRFPARDQQIRPRAGSQQGVGQLGGRAEHVLGVVEDHQQVAVADRVDQGVEHGPSRLLADTEHGGHGAGTSSGSATGASSTSHTPSPAPSSTSAATCSASRDLPIPPGPVIVTSRDPPGHQGPQLGQLPGPADETGGLRRQVVAQRRVVQ